MTTCEWYLYNESIFPWKEFITEGRQIRMSWDWEVEWFQTSRVWDRFLEQTPFWILPWGCPLFQVRHTQFEFPAIFGWKLQKGLFSCLLGSNPGPSSCEASMLPQDHQVWYKLSGKIQQYNHMWREIQIEYVELEERGIPMVKFSFWMFNLAVPISKISSFS